MKVERSIRTISMLMLLAGAAVSSGSALAQAPSQRITSKHSNGMTVMLTNESGKLTEGKNSVCAVFQSIKEGHAAWVQNVEIEFTLLVGRNRGQPITAQMTENAAGWFCGSVDLGQQHYSPATYEIILRYVDVAGKKRKVWFYSSVD
jgi:hypothetical protein